MGRNARGQIIRPTGKRKTWALRVPYKGERVYLKLGRAEDGWNEERAARELRYVLTDIERGNWQPPGVEQEPEEADPRFRDFADDWYQRHEPEWRPSTREDYRWALEHHLLPAFGKLRLSEITAERVDRYKNAKLTEGRIAGAQINKTITRLAQVLEDAVEYRGYVLDHNPASGHRRKLKVDPVKQPIVQPEQLLTLIEAANPRLRPVLATLAGAGLRPGEAVALDWRDVNLATGTIRVERSKTDAGVRAVVMPVGLIGELSELKARSPRTGPDDPVFVAQHRKGKVPRQTKRNVEARLKKAIQDANVKLAALGIEPISGEVRPHSLRRTYASIRIASRDDTARVTAQGGWTDPGFVLRVYAEATSYRERLTGAYAAEFDRALEWARIGPVEREAESKGTATGTEKFASLSDGFRPNPGSPQTALTSQEQAIPGA